MLSLSNSAESCYRQRWEYLTTIGPQSCQSFSNHEDSSLSLLYLMPSPHEDVLDKVPSCKCDWLSSCAGNDTLGEGFLVFRDAEMTHLGISHMCPDDFYHNSSVDLLLISVYFRLGSSDLTHSDWPILSLGPHSTTGLLYLGDVNDTIGHPLVSF